MRLSFTTPLPKADGSECTRTEALSRLCNRVYEKQLSPNGFIIPKVVQGQNKLCNPQSVGPHYVITLLFVSLKKMQDILTVTSTNPQLLSFQPKHPQQKATNDVSACQL